MGITKDRIINDVHILYDIEREFIKNITSDVIKPESLMPWIYTTRKKYSSLNFEERLELIDHFLTTAVEDDISMIRKILIPTNTPVQSNVQAEVYVSLLTDKDYNRPGNQSAKIESDLESKITSDNKDFVERFNLLLLVTFLTDAEYYGIRIKQQVVPAENEETLSLDNKIEKKFLDEKRRIKNIYERWCTGHINNKQIQVQFTDEISKLEQSLSISPELPEKFIKMDDPQRLAFERRKQILADILYRIYNYSRLVKKSEYNIPIPESNVSTKIELEATSIPAPMPRVFEELLDLNRIIDNGNGTYTPVKSLAEVIRYFLDSHTNITAAFVDKFFVTEQGQKYSSSGTTIRKEKEKKKPYID